MTRTLTLLFSALLATGCASKTTITYITEPQGATLFERNSGNYLGATPAVVEYNWDKRFMRGKCLVVNGVDAIWSSGTKSSSDHLLTLCEGKRNYQVVIPYHGNQDQLIVDSQAGYQQQQTVAAQQQADNDAAMYILGASLINSTATLVNASNPPPTFQPAYNQSLQTAQTQNRQLTASNGCTSDYQCGLGLSCIKAPMQNTGQCMQKVNEYGTPLPTISNPSSALPNTNINGQCTLNSECPIGFRCDMGLKVCVK
ncbi:hypothetical protein [Shewanella cutis]|uniref:Lipoprotein n=1 Tax=Shewanella cutis TaxID=2766780 RepID=A0ABS9QXH1_9GAMM|nr:hypothetical protein [Shewanella sp. PS-2]MCG9965058.1 hypothetical protein [Shewanella sp. PS-2]